MYRDHLGKETLELLEQYQRQFGTDVATLYLNFTTEADLQAGIRHALRCGRPIPARYE